MIWPDLHFLVSPQLELDLQEAQREREKALLLSHSLQEELQTLRRYQSWSCTLATAKTTHLMLFTICLSCEPAPTCLKCCMNLQTNKGAEGGVLEDCNNSADGVSAGFKGRPFAWNSWGEEPCRLCFWRFSPSSLDSGGLWMSQTVVSRVLTSLLLLLLNYSSFHTRDINSKLYNE